MGDFVKRQGLETSDLSFKILLLVKQIKSIMIRLFHGWMVECLTFHL